MPLRKDIWRPAIVAAPIADIVRRGSLDGLPLTWLPPMESFRFLADPFGLWRDGRLHVFVETYDYRVRVGSIEALVYDADLRLLDRRPALVEDWHLSYPYVFEAEGATWMLPEAHRSGRLTLYRATEFPWRWEAARVIALDAVAVDATPFRHEDRWWLLYTPATTSAAKVSALHAAFADRIDGPWHPHPGNPIRIDAAGARPGGTPFVDAGRLIVPVQDCSRTYGGAIRPLVVDRLDPTHFAATLGPRLTSPGSAAPFVEGLHTLAAAGAVTLVDVKRTVLSPHGLFIEARREVGKLRRRLSR